MLKEVSLLKDFNDTEIIALIYFIDYLLALPENLSKQLNEEIVTFIQKEAFDMVQLRREDMSPTFAAIAESLEKKGMKKGIEKGRLGEKEEVVRKLLLKHMDMSFIADITGLTVEQILEIQKKYHI